METINNIMGNLSRPPSKNNISIWNIVQIIIMVYLVFCSGKEIYDILFGGKGFQFIEIIKIVINGMILIGFLFSAYGAIKNESYIYKKGFQFFIFGCLGLILEIIKELIKSGIIFSSLIKLLLICFIAYAIMIQMPYI